MIADELKLTPATVSRALNNHPRISKETKELVQETASRLQYKRNQIALSLRTGKSHTIGVIIPSASMNFFGSIVHGIQMAANEYGYRILIYQSEETTDLEIKAIEAFLGARVDGILASLAKGTTDFAHYLELQKKHIPLVLFDRSNDSLRLPSVVIDDYKGGYLATCHLIEQGYRRIAHLAGPQQFQTFQNRLSGYCDALLAHGLPVENKLIFTGNLSIEGGKMAADYFLDDINPPDAVFAVEDFSALGLIKRFKERKVSISRDVGIIGFANELFDEHITPSLSSIDQQTVQMGREAFRMLREIINNGDIAVTPPVPKTVLDPIPVFRESSIRIKTTRIAKSATATGTKQEEGAAGILRT
jgi:LacI family transcriptional regulator